MSLENNNAETSLSSAINSAMNESNENVENTPVAKVEDSEESEETLEETQESEEVEISAADLKLIQDIKNPETRRATLEMLAKAEKLIEEKVEERAEKKEDKPLTPAQIEKTVEQMAREMLGDQYDLLPDKFVDFLEKLIEEKLTPVTKQQEQLQMVSVQQEVDKAIKDLSVELDGFKALENEMNALIPEIPAKETENIEQYMRRLYKHAKGLFPEKLTSSSKEKTSTKESETERKVKVRVTRNSSEPTVRGTTPEKELRSTKAMSLHDAIKESQNELGI